MKYITEGVSVKHLFSEYSKVSFLGLKANQAAILSLFMTLYTLITIVWTSIQIIFLKLKVFEVFDLPFISELSISPYLQTFLENESKCKNYIEKYHFN